MVEPKILHDNATDFEKVMNYFEWLINNLNDSELIDELTRDNQTIQSQLISIKETIEKYANQN